MVSGLLCLRALELPLLPWSPGSSHRGHRRPGPVLRCLWVMEEAAIFFFFLNLLYSDLWQIHRGLCVSDY